MQTIELENLPANPLPVIMVGDTPLTEADIAQETPFHPASSLADAQQQAARALVVRELLAQRAAQLGLAGNDDQAIAQLLEHELQVPQPDQDACRRYYQTHTQRFALPARLQLRHILLPAAPDDAQARDAQYRLGETLLSELAEQPQRFTELAQRHSACPSKDQGGELGWLRDGQTVAELDQAVRRLPVGLHDRPLASRYGWHLVWIDGRQDSQPMPFEQVVDRVQHSLHEEATRNALREYLLALEAEFGVKGFSLAREG
ncbi:PpiC-type peptidyl-prolyl cis-trans isomerase [Pseudomonas sp. StFLB209]|uniref:peptidylprolyl isomerase n=1 Tax=Pseudomonas sp. StFLB209 TaxID=1028989 RepID=UPI0004F893B3|nr:peptidylprolyl isomerase [Pseudomonas sp. StFLB209]BAP44861.1 PpiC-type peptidyl-prolyl cis-trans isomerase [Pseudomonas sp. StFLB209]